MELTRVRLRFAFPRLQILEVAAKEAAAFVANIAYDGVRPRFAQDEALLAPRALQLMHEARVVIADTLQYALGLEIESKRFFA